MAICLFTRLERITRELPRCKIHYVYFAPRSESEADYPVARPFLVVRRTNSLSLNINLSSMYKKNVMPEKQALNSQKGLFYPVSQQSLNEIADIFLCACEVFRGKLRNDVLRGDILLLTYIEFSFF